jgi:putative SOS response-associated peptidase YedK
LDELKIYFPIDRATREVASNYNAAPSQEILAIIRQDGENRLEKLHSGLVPFWARDTSIGKQGRASIDTMISQFYQSLPGFRNVYQYMQNDREQDNWLFLVISAIYI